VCYFLSENCMKQMISNVSEFSLLYEDGGDVLSV
jgi:hypothetical protein